jgi:hypothetical protein
MEAFFLLLALAAFAAIYYFGFVKKDPTGVSPPQSGPNNGPPNSAPPKFPNEGNK